VCRYIGLKQYRNIAYRITNFHIRYSESDTASKKGKYGTKNVFVTEGNVRLAEKYDSLILLIFTMMYIKDKDSSADNTECPKEFWVPCWYTYTKKILFCIAIARNTVHNNMTVCNTYSNIRYAVQDKYNYFIQLA
jgi:hypothetical protein